MGSVVGSGMWLARARRTLAAAVCVAAGTGLAAGCALFRPTEPEPPSGDILVADYSSPEATLATLALAIEDKGRRNGLSVYENGFLADDNGVGFRAFHLPGVIQSYEDAGGTVPPNWTRNEERQFYSQLIQLDSDEYDASWAVDARNQGFDHDDFAADTASRYREYDIASLGTTGRATVAHGYAYLSFVRNNSGDWLIRRWKDIPGEAGDAENETMGALRLELQ